MQTLKKVFSNPGVFAEHPLALFYHCDAAVSYQMHQLGHLMKNSPDNLDRRSTLIQQLKEAQHNLVNVLMHLTTLSLPKKEIASRDFQAKYPDDINLDQLNGPIWFGAECLAAGSQIANHELESMELRPYASALSRTIRKAREHLREESYSRKPQITEKVLESMRAFDSSWAEFEFRYVSLMCSVKTELQYYQQQELIVLFSEAAHRALRKKYLTQDMMEMMDPLVMFAVPRLAIISGLILHSSGPLNPDQPAKDMPSCFRGYKQLLIRIRDLLRYLSEEDLESLEVALCSAEGLGCLDHQTQQLSPPSSSSHTQPQNVPIKSTSEREAGFAHSTSNVSRTSARSSDIDSQSTGRKATDGWITQSSPQLPSSPVPDSSESEHNAKVLREPHIPAQGKRHQAPDRPAGFCSTQDLMHRLFVAVSGVADQLQTNHAQDLRVILKHVFNLCLSEAEELVPSQDGCEDLRKHRTAGEFTVGSHPDSQAISFNLSLSTLGSAAEGRSSDDVKNMDSCFHCHGRFSSIMRRKHHCRLCRQAVCGRCAPHSIPMSSSDHSHRFIRVCGKCYIKELSQAVQALSSSCAATSVVSLGSSTQAELIA